MIGRWQAGWLSSSPSSSLPYFDSIGQSGTQAQDRFTVAGTSAEGKEGGEEAERQGPEQRQTLSSSSNPQQTHTLPSVT